MPTQKVALLAAYLTVESGRPHNRARVAGMIWPDGTDKAARDSLRQALSTLRRLLGDRDIEAPRVQSTREVLTLTLQPSDFQDVLALREVGKHLQTGEVPEEALATAAASVRGAFLEDVHIPEGALDEWVLGARMACRADSLRVLDALVDIRLAQGRWDQVADLVSRQFVLEPTHEAAFRYAMRAAIGQGHRDEAIRCYERCHETLVEHLGVRPSVETRQLHRSILEERPLERVPERVAARPRIRDRPSLEQQIGTRTSFIGREEELALALDKLRTGRLITLHGPGGQGKTRLAEQIGLAAERDFAGGAAWVALGTVTNAAELTSACVAALALEVPEGSEAFSVLASNVGTSRFLLVLDEAEHCARGLVFTDWLTTLLERCQGLTVLATSRERLKLQVEEVVEVGGLTEAEVLFRARAALVSDEPLDTPTATTAVAALCEQVGRSPLGVELAARLLRNLTMSEVARVVSRDVGLLKSDLVDVAPKHGSVDALFEPSWQALSPAARVALAKCSVFRGGFDLRGAEAVAGLDVTLLTELMDAALVTQSGHGRYDLHPLVRQLAASRDEDPAGNATRHATWYRDLTIQRVHAAFGIVDVVDLDIPRHHRNGHIRDELHTDAANVRAALRTLIAAADNPEAVSPFLEAWWLFLRVERQWARAEVLLEAALHVWPDAPSRRVTAPIVWRYLLGVSESAQFRIDATIGHLERVLMLLEHPPSESAMGHIVSIGRNVWAGGVYAPVSAPSGPTLETDRTARMLTACALELSIHTFLRRGPLAMLALTTLGARSIATVRGPAISRPVMSGAMAMMGAVGGRPAFSEKWRLHTVSQLKGARGPVEAMTRMRLALQGLVTGRPWSEIIGDRDRAVRLVEADFPGSKLMLELFRIACIFERFHGDYAGLESLIQRGLASCPASEPAQRVVFVVNQALLAALTGDVALGAELARQVVAMDVPSGRTSIERDPVVAAHMSWCLLRGGHLEEALELADAGHAGLQAHGDRGSVMLIHNMVGPADAYLTALESGAVLSARRKTALKTVLKQLTRIAGFSPYARPAQRLLVGRMAAHNGSPDRALTLWEQGLTEAIRLQTPFQEGRLREALGQS